MFARASNGTANRRGVDLSTLVGTHAFEVKIDGLRAMLTPAARPTEEHHMSTATTTRKATTKPATPDQSDRPGQGASDPDPRPHGHRRAPPPQRCTEGPQGAAQPRRRVPGGDARQAYGPARCLSQHREPESAEVPVPKDQDKLRHLIAV